MTVNELILKLHEIRVLEGGDLLVYLEGGCYTQGPAKSVDAIRNGHDGEPELWISVL